MKDFLLQMVKLASDKNEQFIDDVDQGLSSGQVTVGLGNDRDSPANKAIWDKFLEGFKDKVSETSEYTAEKVELSDNWRAEQAEKGSRLAGDDV